MKLKYIDFSLASCSRILHSSWIQQLEDFSTYVNGNALAVFSVIPAEAPPRNRILIPFIWQTPVFLPKAHH